MQECDIGRVQEVIGITLGLLPPFVLTTIRLSAVYKLFGELGGQGFDWV